MLPHFIPSIASTGFSAEGDVSGQGGPPGPTETVSLSGTSSLPSSFFGPFPIGQGGTWNVNTGFTFTSGGNINRSRFYGDSPHSSPQWNNTTPSTTYYIRFTNDSTGSSFQVTPNAVSPTLGTWGALTSSRYFLRVENNAEFGGYGQRFIQCKVEIATDSGGSNIIATGYYKAQWEGGA